APDLGAMRLRLAHERVDVLHVDHDAHRHAADVARIAMTELGMLVGDHEQRVADLELRMADAAVRRGEPHHLGGAEILLVEIDCPGRAANDEVRNRGPIAIWNWFDGHGKAKTAIMEKRFQRGSTRRRSSGGVSVSPGRGLPWSSSLSQPAFAR